MSHIDGGAHDRLASVPNDYASRKELWIRSSVWLSCNEAPFVSLSVQTLGYAERMLLEMEGAIARLVGDQQKRSKRETLLMECASHSILWILGLYEVIRLVKDANPPKFQSLKSIFELVEILRMPLAKHEVKSTSGYREIPHYPTGLQSVETGRVGWWVFNPHTKTSQGVMRTEVANEFLAITAAEPLMTYGIPIGGPLGRPDPIE